MALKNRKNNKLRGSRTLGHGSHKKNRGAGNRGGTGMGGHLKGKYTWIVKHTQKYYGRYGFDLPKEKKDIYNTINIGELDENADQLLNEGLAEKEGKKIVIDLSRLECEKVLGGGKVTRPLKIKASRFSKNAIKKIEQADGEAVVME